MTHQRYNNQTPDYHSVIFVATALPQKLIFKLDASLPPNLVPSAKYQECKAALECKHLPESMKRLDHKQGILRLLYCAHASFVLSWAEMKRLDHKQGVLHGPPMYVFPFRQSCTEIPLPVCAWRYFCKSCTHIVPATVEIMHQNASACVCMEILLQVINSDSPCIVFKSCIEMLLPVFEKYRSLVALTQSLANVAAHCAETSRFCVIELAGYVENLKGKQGHETSLLKLPGLVPVRFGQIS
eukprot:1138818-Pelagomonas_calceolata.AAC.8